MLIGTIRPVEKTSIDLTGTSLEDVHRQAAIACPDGFELVSVPVKMHAGTTDLTATATFHRRDGGREVDADDMPALRGKVPDGWTLTSVRKV